MKSSLRQGTTIGLVLLLVLNAIVMVPIAASAATTAEPIVMMVPNIPGSSTLQGYKGWIEVLSFTGSGAAPATSGGAGPPCQMVVQKPLDIASPHLWVATVTGQTFQSIDIRLLKTGTTGSLYALYEIKLEIAEFTSIGDSSSNGLPLESLTLKASRVVLTFTTENPNGSLSMTQTTFTC
jgi:type VI secretion system Hcp family effector